MKTYLCRKIDGYIRIDGNIEKPVWKDIDEITLVDTYNYIKYIPIGGK